MRMNRLSFIASLVFLWSNASADAQSSRVIWYAFDAGFVVSTAPNTAIKSAVGQVMVGSTQQPNDFITSGFLANPLLGGGVVGVGENEELPLSYSLSQNYPNPFNPSTTIRFEIPLQSRVELIIYNVIGQKIATLFDEEKEAGRYSVVWNGRNETGSDVGSGVYFSCFRAEGYVAVRKLMLVR